MVLIPVLFSRSTPWDRICRRISRCARTSLALSDEVNNPSIRRPAIVVHREARRVPVPVAAVTPSDGSHVNVAARTKRPFHTGAIGRLNVIEARDNGH